MKKYVFCSLALLAIGLTAKSQGKGSVLDNAAIDVKKFNAKLAFDGDDYITATKLYTEILNARPQDAETAFHLGECYQEQDDYSDAVTCFEKAEKINADCDDDLHMKLGQIYLEVEQVDNALKEFDIYKKKFAASPKKIIDNDIDHFIKQCQNAKTLMAKPVKVVVVSLGEAVNTAYDEKSPSVTADGKTLIFTSQRPVTMGKMGKNGEAELLDNVYMSAWDSVNSK